MMKEQTQVVLWKRRVASLERQRELIDANIQVAKVELFAAEALLRVTATAEAELLKAPINEEHR